jgi:hypothetical protein
VPVVGRWVAAGADLGVVLGHELLALPCGISADSALKSLASEVLPSGRANQLKMPDLQVGDYLLVAGDSILKRTQRAS